MSGVEIYFLLAGAAAGGLINGLAGFGTALFALGFWLQIMPPQQAVAIALVLSVASGLQGVWVVRRATRAQPKRLLRFLLPGIIGIPLGSAMLAVLEPAVLKIVVALFLLAYGGFFSLRRSLPKFERPTPLADGLVGFLGGILGGAASLSGALPTMWCALRPWSKAETRGVLQPYNVVILFLACLALAIQGAYSPDTIWKILVAFPVTMLAAQIGIMLFRRLSDDLFRRLLIGLMLLSGVILLARELIQ